MTCKHTKKQQIIAGDSSAPLDVSGVL